MGQDKLAEAQKTAEQEVSMVRKLKVPPNVLETSLRNLLTVYRKANNTAAAAEIESEISRLSKSDNPAK
jgi:hypothetical protein